MAAAQDRALAVLVTAAGPLPAGVVAERVDRSYSATHMALTRLINRGLARESHAHTGGREWVVYSPTEAGIADHLARAGDRS